MAYFTSNDDCNTYFEDMDHIYFYGIQNSYLKFKY